MWKSINDYLFFQGLDANGKPLLELHLIVQFHVESPLLLHDEMGRHLYFLQLRHNVRSRDALPAEVLLLLTGLALQAEYGDADTYEDRDYFKVEEYAPPSLTGDWVAAAMRACHREHRGLPKSDAEIRFIREVCLLPDTINSHRYRLKQSKSEPEPGTVWLLVTAKGIKILPDNGPLSNFIWSAIGKLSFDRKKFEIRTEEGKITLYSSSEEKCKYLFALCKETHQFSMKIAPKFNEVLRKEEEERKICFGYSKSFNLQYNQNKSEQRISVISSTSSNTTSGIVSDRVQSEDELEIMIDSPPAPSTESLAFAHLLDSSNSYFTRQASADSQPPLSKSASLQLQKPKGRGKKSKDESDKVATKDIPTSETGQSSGSQLDETTSLPDQSVSETLSDSPTSSKLKCTGSQCSSSCSTVIMARAGLSTLSRTSNGSSLELGYSHTAQNSMLSDNSTVGIDVEYPQDTASALYDGLGQPVTVAASSETSGVYTMASSELTGRSKMDTLSEDSRTEYDGSHYDSYKPAQENDLADFDSVSSILKNKSERSHPTTSLRLQTSMPSSDCVDGAPKFTSDEQVDKDMFRERTNSNTSAVSFHGDGSDPTDNKHNLLTASELTDLIVGRGVYPKSQSVSDTLDSVSDYVRLPLPFSGDSYIQGHEDTAPSDDNYPNNAFFDRPPTPPTRTDSRKLLHLSLPNILDIDVDTVVRPPPPFPNKPPPPYEFNHRTVSPYAPTALKEPPAYPGKLSSTLSLKQPSEKEEVAARVVTSKPMITILKAEAGDVNAPSERNFASPMVLEHRFQKSKRNQASSRRAERSKLAQGMTNNLSPSREMPHGVDSNVLVAMMKLPPPPPPPRRTRLPPPPPVSRLPPPPPPHNPMFHQQLYSDVDYVYYPLQDPMLSQQNYLDHKLTETRMTNMQKNSLQYRSTPYLSTTLSASSMYGGSIQNLSDSYVQLPGNRASWYSLTSRTSLSSMNHERPPMPSRIPDMSYFVRTKSDENILSAKDPPPIKMRRMPPPPPPPYEHKKKLPSHLRDIRNQQSTSNFSDVSANKVKDNCDLDIKTLREKSKNLDLPLIAALCNDRSLLKQTKAFGAPKLGRPAGSDCESDWRSAKSVTNTDSLSKHECNARKQMTGSQKKIMIRNPTDKLPALPVSESHTPRAMSNTYVMHPSVIKTKKTQPSS